MFPLESEVSHWMNGLGEGIVTSLCSPVRGSITAILFIVCSAIHKFLLLSNAIPNGLPFELRGRYSLNVFITGLKTDTAYPSC
jgi:hypothetical protein